MAYCSQTVVVEVGTAIAIGFHAHYLSWRVIAFDLVSYS
jgi:hypothetical protein